MAITSTADIQGKFTCATCGGLFSAGEGYDDNGVFICHGCYQSRVALTNAVASAAATQQATLTARRRAPSYSGIARGAALLQRQVQFLRICGWLAIAAAVAVPIAVTLAANDKDKVEAIMGSILFAVSALLVALMLFNYATLIQMLAELALAHRDIAQNSFE